MRQKKPFKLTVPYQARKKLLECIILNRPQFDYHIDNFFWLMDAIIQFSALHNGKRLKPGGFVSVSSSYMEAHLGGQYARHMTYLEINGFVQCDHSYDVERGIPTGYKLCYEWLENIDPNKDNVFINCSSPLWQRMEDFRRRKKKERDKKLRPSHRMLKPSFSNLEMDYKGAREFVMTLQLTGKEPQVKRSIYLKMIDNMEEEKCRYYSVSNNGRLNTNLTNLLKELRRFIIGDKVVIDLKNSQPYFLGQIFKMSSSCISYCSPFTPYYTHTSPVFKGIYRELINCPKTERSEVLDFCKRCSDGSIYEHIQAHVTHLGHYRSQVKKKFLAMLYSNNDEHYYWEYEQVFQRLYPSLYDVTGWLKMNDHSALSISMQRLEADVFIDCAAVRIVNEGIEVLTIHDSLVVDRIHLKTALRILKSVFQERFKDVPTFGVTNLDDSLVEMPVEFLFGCGPDPIPFYHSDIASEMRWCA